MNKVVRLNSLLVEEMLSEDESRFENLQKILYFINMSDDIDIVIHSFNDSFEEFKEWITSYDELIDFSYFYKSVDGNLSASYFICSATSNIRFITGVDEVIKFLKKVVDEELTVQESFVLYNFLVQAFID